MHVFFKKPTPLRSDYMVWSKLGVYLVVVFSLCLARLFFFHLVWEFFHSQFLQVHHWYLIIISIKGQKPYNGRTPDISPLATTHYISIKLIYHCELQEFFFLENGDYFESAGWFPSHCRTFTRCWLPETKVSISPQFLSSMTEKKCYLGAECVCEQLKVE